MKKTLISSAYIYPICPLNINHAKMFIVGDIIARYSRFKGNEVFFPIASHYSGNTAQNIAKKFTDFFAKNFSITNDEKKVYNLYKDLYHVPINILKNFTNPLNILNFYNQEILWELKSLGVSGDYEYAYTTGHEDFSIYINTIISLYKKNNLLVVNDKNELALDYNNDNWIDKTKKLLDNTEFIQSFHKNNILSAMKNIRNDWGFLRDDGFGVVYEEKWIIDPMFDSELFTMFDLYIKFKKESTEKNLDIKSVFNNLFDVLINKEKPKTKLVEDIIKWLPCDFFVCEEHLKNWVVKKLYAESCLLDEKYQTKKYFVLGMGSLNGKRMSASRGNAIFVNDLINSYGPNKSRMIILLGGGHPSKNYDFDTNLPSYVDKLLNNFTNYYSYLLSISNGSIIIDSNNISINIDENTVSNIIEENINKGYYRQAIIELISILPSKYQYPDKNSSIILLSIYKRYLYILLPNLLDNFIIN